MIRVQLQPCFVECSCMADWVDGWICDVWIDDGWIDECSRMAGWLDM